jgi:peptide/nickel transport system substrate-binding protein
MGNRKRFNRKQFLVASGALAVTPWLAACQPAAPTSVPAAPAAAPAPAPPAPAAAPKPTGASGAPAPALTPAQPVVAIKRGGILYEGHESTYRSMDAHFSDWFARPGMRGMYNTLVQLSEVDPVTWDMKVIPDLAETWEQPDAQTLIFHLRKGVLFHDGSEFNAEVAAWNYLRTRDHPKSFNKPAYSIMESAKALDKHTLELKLKQPNAGFLRVMCQADRGFVGMMSKEAMDKHGEDQLLKHPIGTGPFRFKEWLVDDRLTLERNPDYFETGADGKSLPYLDGVIGRVIPDPAVSIVEIRSGGLHMIERIAAKDLAAVQADPNLVVKSMPWASVTGYYGGFNQYAPPFDDVRVRQAFHYGIDREGLAKTFGFGIAVPWHYLDWAKGALGYDESIKKYEFNPARAKELLAEAGYPNGITVKQTFSTGVTSIAWSEYQQARFKESNINLVLDPVETVQWREAVRAKRHQVTIWGGGLHNSFIDPDLMRGRLGCDQIGNWAQSCDPELDKLLDAGSIEIDPAKRHEIYREALRITQEGAYRFIGYLQPLLHVHHKNVKGVYHHYGDVDLKGVWLDV